MLASSTGMKSSLQKKKQSSTTNNTSTSVQLSMNKTSLSSISTTSQNNNKDKLCQLKEKLEKQRQSMRNTGRRFREGGKSEVEIQTDDGVHTGNSRREIGSKGLKVAKGSGSGGLFDFESLKTQVQNKMRGGFVKKAQQIKKSEGIIPVYTTKQILQMSQSSKVQNAKNTELLNGRQPLHEKKQLKRQTVSLMELSQVISDVEISTICKKDQKISPGNELRFVNLQKTVKKSQQQSATSSNSFSSAFEMAIKQQRERNNEVRQFLSHIKLERFADDLISMGFDQVQTLLHVTLEELNMAKMRAKDQDTLIKYIRDYKVKNNIQDNFQQYQLLVSGKPSQIKKSYTRPISSRITKQQLSQTTTQASRLRSTTPNLSQSLANNLLQLTSSNLSQSTLSNKSSIFYLMGGNQWSLQSQIRKACSGCFKVTYQAVKRYQCYYCEQCDPGENEISISLNSSMVRDYQ